DVHRLADRDDRVGGLAGDAFRGAVAGARLLGGDGRVRDEVDGGADDAGVAAVEDDRAVHLGEFAQPGGGELDVELEAARADLFDRLVVAEHDQAAGVAPKDPLQSVADLGARGHRGQRGAASFVMTLVVCWHLTPGGRWTASVYRGRPRAGSSPGRKHARHGVILWRDRRQGAVKATCRACFRLSTSITFMPS